MCGRVHISKSSGTNPCLDNILKLNDLKVLHVGIVCCIYTHVRVQMRIMPYIAYKMIYTYMYTMHTCTFCTTEWGTV